MKLESQLLRIRGIFGFPWILARYAVNRFMRQIKIRKPPIFIVGCGHSGTSVLLAILGAHSNIYAVPRETRIVKGKNSALKLMRFDFLAISESKNRWVQKTPQNVLNIDRLLKMYPDATILLIIRDGRDVACSIQDRHNSIEAGIKRWVKDNRAGQEFWEHPHVYGFKYEDLVEDFDSTMKRVLTFLGEEYEPEIRDYYKKPKRYYSVSTIRPKSIYGKNNHAQFRNWQINQPLFDGRGTWKRMTEEEKIVVKECAGDMLIEYGYVANNDW